MNIFQLVCFVTLSSASTFSEAAEKLYISQSSFSNNIQSIEKELSISLVTRGARALSLTEAGREFLVYAEKIVKEYERMNGLLMDYRQSAGNRVVIYTDPLSSYGFNHMLVRFKLNLPEIQTEIIELAGKSFDDILETQKDAVGIVFSTDSTAPAGTRSHTLVADRLAALVDMNHRFAKQERLKMSDLNGVVLQIISNRQSRFLNEFVLTQCRKAGFEPRIALYDLWYCTIQEIVHNPGIPAVIPEEVAKIFCLQDMSVVSIDAEGFYINVVISDKCTHSAALKFFEFAKSSR